MQVFKDNYSKQRYDSLTKFSLILLYLVTWLISIASIILGIYEIINLRINLALSIFLLIFGLLTSLFNIIFVLWDRFSGFDTLNGSLWFEKKKWLIFSFLFLNFPFVFMFCYIIVVQKINSSLNKF